MRAFKRAVEVQNEINPVSSCKTDAEFLGQDIEILVDTGARAASILEELSKQIPWSDGCTGIFEVFIRKR